MAQIIITGQVTFIESGNPISGVRVELWDKTLLSTDNITPYVPGPAPAPPKPASQGFHLIVNETGFGWLVSTIADEEGSFTLTINDPAASAIGNLNLVYRVYKNNILITEIAIANYTDPIKIAIEEAAFDAHFIDNTDDISSTYVKFCGQIFDANSLPIDQVIVNIYENGFRTKNLLANVVTDLYGNYEAKINTKSITNSFAIVNRSIRIEVTDLNAKFIAASDDIFNWQEQTTIFTNFETAYLNTTSKFEKLVANIQAIIKNVSIASLQVNTTTNTNEPEYIAGVIGASNQDVYLVVAAYQLNSTYNLDAGLSYVLCNVTGPGLDAFLAVSDIDAIAAIEAAMSDNTISVYSQNDINAFIAARNPLKVTQTTSTLIPDETYTFNDVLSAVFTNQQDINNFVAAYNVPQSSIEAFWASYASTYGQTLANAAILGLRLSAITSYQPQTMKQIISDLGSSDISSLATWTLSSWSSLISQVCTASKILCVPASIRKGATDPNDQAVQLEYAKTLMMLTQAMFPLAYVNSQLQNQQTGTQIIPDSFVRGEVSTFISNNPTYDSRYNSVYDINQQTWNLTGITSLTSLQTGLLPFQRLMRVVGGNPSAICNLIINGITSAKNIADLGLDAFRNNYAYLFPGTESLSESRSMFSAVSSMFPTTTTPAVLSAVPPLETAYSVSLSATTATTSSLVSSISLATAGAFSYPLSVSPTYIPPITPAFSTPITTGDPSLVSLFGNLDYCNCCDCKSVYSPAAYVSDTLYYLKSNALDVYNALINKRPDLINIDLSCQNSDTPLPYIDLVNELLELRILYSNPSMLPLPINEFSFQTTGTQEQLAAYPEHTYKNLDYNYEDFTAYLGGAAYQYIYNSLNSFIFPALLPFNLAECEARNYLQHFGISRYDLMKLFYPVNQASYSAIPPTTSITDFSLSSEALGISQTQGTIISGVNSYCSTAPWEFYGATSGTAPVFLDPLNPAGTVSGGNWLALLSSRLDLLLQQTGIQYDDLLQYLTTDFLNQVSATYSPVTRLITIGVTSAVASPPPPDTCQLNFLDLQFYGQTTSGTLALTFFNKLYRFIRLANSGTYSIYQWDILLRSLYVTSNSPSSSDINNQVYLQLGKTVEYTKQLNIRPEVLSMWWNNIDTTEYLNYPAGSTTSLPTIYDTIFNNKNVVNNNSANAFVSPFNLPSQYNGYTGQIANCCRISENDVISLLAYLSISLSTPVHLEVLSRLYILSQLAQCWQYSIKDFITILSLGNIEVPTINAGGNNNINTYISNLQEVIDLVNAIQICGFSVAQLDYLIAGTDPADPVAPNPTNIEQFLESLRSDLSKCPLYIYPIPSPPDSDDLLYARLSDLIYQHFSKEFGVSLQVVSDIFSVYPGAELLLDFLNNNFVTSTYPLSENNVIYIDTLVPGTVLTYPSPPDGTNDIIPDFKLHTFYDWYRYFFKLTMIIKIVGLRNAEFNYLFTHPFTGVQFDFTELPVDSGGSPDILYNVSGIEVSVTLNQALLGLLRLSHIMDIIKHLSLPEDSLGKILDATYGIITPPINGMVPPAPISSSDLSGLNTCFTNLLDVINLPEWGTMLFELIGNEVAGTPTLGLTYNNSVTPSQTALLSTYFTISTITSSFSPANYQNITMLQNIISILNWCETIGLTPTNLQKILVENISSSDSITLIIAAKGKYNDEDWAKIAKPLRDPIRVAQRDALVAYTNSNPNLLFGSLLIDPEMDACMTTTRIKQAISSIQLFVDRVILGLEFSPTSPTERLSLPVGVLNEWQGWRKWYSVWEANRQVFFYPEDWMEPELRDDKTELFTQLEAELKQNEVTDESAQDVMANYLQSLSDIAKLEPVGMCDQLNTDGSTTTHVISRTFGGTPTYYYRTIQNNIWSAWEKINVGITSSHVIPVIWNNRLYLFWLTFADQTASYTPAMSNMSISATTGLPTSLISNYWFYNDVNGLNSTNTNNGTNTKSYKQVQITLNWTEYKEGGWQKQKAGTQPMVLKINPWLEQYLTDVFAGTISNPTEKQLFNQLMNNGQLQVSHLFKSRLILSSYIPGVSTAQTILYLPGLTTPVPVNGDLYLQIQFPLNINTSGTTMPAHTEFADFIKAFHLGNDGKFEVTQNMQFVKRSIAPSGTAFKNIGATTYNNDPTQSTPLKLDIYLSESGGGFYTTQYVYDQNGPSGAPTVPWPGSTYTILGSSKSGYKLKFKSEYINPLDDKFFYEDTANTFFIDKQDADFITAFPPYPSLSYVSHYVTYLYNPAGYSYVTDNYIYAIYYFQTFYHSSVPNFKAILNEYGVDGLMRPDLLNLLTLPIVQNPTDTMNFNGNYTPTALVINTGQFLYPENYTDFGTFGAYSIYNWELFFHIPMLVAGRLSNNQQFADARKWYHYIFDPTSSSYLNGDTAPTSASQKFWKFLPFYQLAGSTIETIEDLLEQINAGISSAVSEVNSAGADPFEPFAIARSRPIAFMKNVIMKYLDNLIAWGDYLFTQDTIESINEASQLYIMASNILGNKPAAVPQRAEVLSYSFNELLSYGVDAIGDAAVAVEGYIDPYSTAGSTVSTGGGIGAIPDILYFCLPPDDKLLGYWDTVADRLYKIRHCENISGVMQQLPIYEPPINPALLVQAAALGIDISSVVNDVSGSTLPNYRYTYIVQKANEFCSDVKGLGSSLLSALEKSDAEALAVLRQGQEVSLLTAILTLKQQQLDEANANLDALNSSLVVATAKYNYYSGLQQYTDYEKAYLTASKASRDIEAVVQGMDDLAVLHAFFPDFALFSPFAIGPQYGGSNMVNAVNAAVASLNSAIAVSNLIGSVANIQGSWDRRWTEWQYQKQNAQLEIDQVNKQIIAAKKRIDIAQTDCDNQQLQIDNAKAVNDFMTNKYTNQQLYDWMSSQISGTYFQAYQLAYSLAKKAELCYKNELPLSTSAQQGFITPKYWDSLHKGLLAGENLQCDIRNMESAYITDNTRVLELTKHISLAMLQPDQLVALKATGSCTVSIPEEMYDLDYPGHFNRIIKSVSITIPCVAGPYTTVPCTLAHSGSFIRRSTSGATPLVPVSNLPCASIATSSAQNDNGMFEFNFRDERYLPFEGAGAISQWNLTLTNNLPLSSIVQTFDFGTISDVILHVKYTASNGNNSFAVARAANLKTLLNEAMFGTVNGISIPLPRYFSLKHEFPNEWFQFTNDIASGVPSPTLNIIIDINHFPFFCEGHTVTVNKAGFAKRLVEYESFNFNISTTGYTAAEVNTTCVITSLSTVSVINGTSSAALSFTVTPDTGFTLSQLSTNLADIYMVLIYQVSE